MSTSGAQEQLPESRRAWLNFIDASIPGCYVVRPEFSSLQVEETALDVEDFGLEPCVLDSPERHALLPELSVDPESSLLTVINCEKEVYKSFAVSITDECLPARDLKEEEIPVGKYSLAGDAWKDCVTLVVLVKPLHCVDLCYLASLPVQVVSDKSGIHSDVQRIPLQDVEDSIGAAKVFGRCGAEESISTEKLAVYGFPLEEEKGPYLCSQGFGGAFTHFFKATRYAVDFECFEGTPVVAIADGVVVECCDTNKDRGIFVNNLFSWNSITLDLLDGSFAEYVHIFPGSSVVKVGDRVKQGQLLCTSGNVGFSPKPHLHLQITESNAKDAPTKPFMLKGKNSQDSKPFIPVAGKLYP